VVSRHLGRGTDQVFPGYNPGEPLGLIG
jgi:hypothetical protein